MEFEMVTKIAQLGSSMEADYVGSQRQVLDV